MYRTRRRAGAPDPSRGSAAQTPPPPAPDPSRSEERPLPTQPTEDPGAEDLARALLEEARSTLAEVLEWRHDVIFTSGASEAIEIAAAMLQRRRCLVHGDLSPKNVLLGGGGLWVIDFEVAHVGDPAFDLGAEIDVPTLDGKVKMRIPPGTQSGKIFRLKGKGIKDIQGYQQGDQNVRVIVETPTHLTSKQRELLKEFAALGGEEVNPMAKGFFDKMKELFG